MLEELKEDKSERRSSESIFDVHAYYAYIRKKEQESIRMWLVSVTLKRTKHNDRSRSDYEKKNCKTGLDGSVHYTTLADPSVSAPTNVQHRIYPLEHPSLLRS